MLHWPSKCVSLIFVSLTSFLRELLLCLRMREPLSSTCFPFPRVIIISRSKLVWVCNCVIQSFVYFWRSNLKYLQSPSSSHTNHCICITADVILVKDIFLLQKPAIFIYLEAHSWVDITLIRWAQKHSSKLESTKHCSSSKRSLRTIQNAKRGNGALLVGHVSKYIAQWLAVS